MKNNKILIILIVLFLIIVFSIYILFNNMKNQKFAIKKYNQEYEMYLNKEISGLELATLINKTVNLNEKNNVKKDEKEHYIENAENSIKIEIKLSATNKTYSMEEFYNNNTSEFVKYFAEEKFNCTQISYHKKNGKIKKLEFIQIEK